MNKKQKKNLIRIIVTTIMMIILNFLPVTGIPRLFLYLIPYFLIGYDVLKKAIEGIIHRQPFDEGLLMTIATIGAIVLGIIGDGDYVEAIAVMLFYQIGEWFQSYAVGKSRKNIAELMDIRPDTAFIESDGDLEEVDAEDVEVGTIIVIKAGERIPIDGVITEGTTSLNTAALTGESLPREATIGDEVLSGSININGLIKVRTTKEFDESTASKIIELIEDASSRKSKSEDFIAKFARVYTPIVVYAALALAFIPAIFLMITGKDPMWGQWIYRALTFLVISCPCALVISIPLSFFAGIGGASRQGVLVKGSNYLEILSNTKTVMFDKTGTLTKGNFEVTSIHPVSMSEEELLHLAATVEKNSNHPIAKSLRDKDTNTDVLPTEQSEEIAGRGITAVVDQKKISAGNDKMMKDLGIAVPEIDEIGTIIHVAIEKEYAGYIVISDVVKEHSALAMKELKNNGVRKTIMLTGDSEKVAANVAKTLGLDTYYAELLPQDKVTKEEEIISQKTNDEDVVAFVGDGINDAPVLALADVGIAMGALGSDAAIEAADVVLMDDDPLKIVTAIKISRKCLRIVKQNIWFAIGVKVLCLILSAFGLANMWLAIFADVGVMIIAVLNAIRCLHVENCAVKA